MKRTLLSITLLLTLRFLTCAQDASRDLSEMSLEELMYTRVISSTQEYVRAREAPSSVFVVTGDQIRRWGIRKLSELVDRLVPGAIVTEDGDDLILAFRGVSSDNNTKVLLLWNGHYYNTQWTNGPSSEVELGMLEDIDRVEVVLGPGSALYGSGAMIAVINMIPLSGSQWNGIRGMASYGSGDYKKGELIGGASKDSNLNFLFSVGGLSSEGFTNNDNEPLNISRYPSAYRFYGDVQYKDLQVMTRFTHSSRAFYLFKASDTRPNIYTDYDTYFIDLRKNFQLRPDVRFSLAGTYDTIQTQRHDFTLGTKLRAVGEDRYGVKGTFFWQPASNMELVLGSEYRRDEFGSDWSGGNFNFLTMNVNGVVTGIPSDPFSRRTLTPYGRNVFGVFGQFISQFHEIYKLLVGFRYDWIGAYGISDRASLTPRVALVVQPNDKTIYKLMFSGGFRAPIAALTSPDGFAFGTQIDNRIQDPERIYSIEFNASREFHKNSILGVTCFYNFLFDLHGLDPHALPRPVFISAGRVDFVGFEALAHLSFTKDSFLRLSHQFVQFGSSVDDPFGAFSSSDEKKLLTYPGNVTKLLFDAQLTNHWSWNTNLNVIWGSSANISEAPGTGHVGSYVTWNANLIYDFNSNLQIMLSGYNLTNERGKILPTLLDFFDPAERNFLLSLRVKY